MQNKYVVDSSIFVAFYYAGDENHTAAVQIMKELSLEQILLHSFVVAEVATVLTYKFSKDIANTFLKDIKKLRIISTDTHLDSDAFLSETKKMSFVDITLIQLAKNNEAHLITFDKQMISSFKKK